MDALRTVFDTIKEVIEIIKGFFEQIISIVKPGEEEAE